MNPAEHLQRLIGKTSALREGAFVLSSGATSPYYVDSGKITLHPEGALAAATAMVEQMDRRGLTHAVGAAEGSIPIISHITLFSALRAGSPIPGCYNRRVAKEHGAKAQFEGQVPPEGTRVAVVEDVVNTGNTLLNAIKAVEEHGLVAALAMTLIERDPDGGAKIRGAGYDYLAIVTLDLTAVPRIPLKRGAPPCTTM